MSCYSTKFGPLADHVCPCGLPGPAQHTPAETAVLQALQYIGEQGPPLDKKRTFCKLQQSCCFALGLNGGSLSISVPPPQKLKLAEPNFPPPGFISKAKSSFLTSLVQLIAHDAELRNQYIDRLNGTDPLKDVLIQYREVVNGNRSESGAIDLSALYADLPQELQKEREQDVYQAFSWLIHCRELPEKIESYFTNPSFRSLLQRGMSTLTVQVSSSLKMEYLVRDSLQSSKIFTEAPECLFVHLNRFKLSSDGESIKDRSKILEIGGFSLKKGIHYKAGAATVDYFIQSYSLHIGESIRSGRYITYIKTCENRKDQFWICDNEQVTKISEEEFNRFSEDAYLIMYSI